MSIAVHAPVGSDRARARSILAAIERRMSFLPAHALSTENRAATAALIDAWTELVKLLALSPAPELRQCLFCGNVGVTAATRCGYCWSEIPTPYVGHGQKAPGGAS